MERKAAEYSTSHKTRNQQDHKQDHRPEGSAEATEATEAIAEWQANALKPFVEHLYERNPNLAWEIARDSAAVTDNDHTKNPTSWLDDHQTEPKHPGSYDYEERAKNQAESDIVLSYQEAAKELTGEQLHHLNMTIVEAMSHRANTTLSHHFPQMTNDYAANHGHPDVAQPQSYNRMMRAATDYYASALQINENLLSKSLKTEGPNDPYSITFAVDAFRSLEADMEQTALTGAFPEYIDAMAGDRDYRIALADRASYLLEQVNAQFHETYPDQSITPDNPQYVEHFRESTKDYLPGDLHNAANYLSYHHAIATAVREGHQTPKAVAEASEQIMTKTYNSLTGRDKSPST